MDQAFCQYLSLRRIAHCHAMPLDHTSSTAENNVPAAFYRGVGAGGPDGGGGGGGATAAVGGGGGGSNITTGPPHGDAGTRPHHGDAATRVIEVDTWTEAGDSEASMSVTGGVSALLPLQSQDCTSGRRPGPGHRPVQRVVRKREREVQTA